MGETPAETLTEIEAARARLQTDLDALEARLPERDELVEQAKLVGGAAAGGTLVLTALGIAAARANRRRKHRKHARFQAEALADVLTDGRPVSAHVEHTSSKTGPIALLTSLAALAVAVATYLQSRQQPEPSTAHPNGQLP